MNRILILLVFFTLSCKHEEILLNKPRENESNLAPYLSNNAEYTLFTYALKRTGLLDTLNTDHEFTVLAVKNSIYALFGINNTSDLDLIEVSNLKKQIANHILPQRLSLDEIPSDQYNVGYRTLLGNTLKAHKSKMKVNAYYRDSHYTIATPSTVDAMVSFSGSMVINKVSILDHNLPFANEGDLRMRNGLIHNVNKPIQMNLQMTIQEYLENNPRYTIFVKMLKHFQYWDYVSQLKKATIFVPSDMFLESIGITEDYILGLAINEYDKDLLIGAYFLEGLEYLLSDYIFFLNKDLQYWFQNKIDSKYYSLINGIDYFKRTAAYLVGVDRLYVGVSEIPMPVDYPIFPVGEDCSRFLGIGGFKAGPSLEDPFRFVRYCTAITGNTQYCDILLENGVVHELEGVLVLPEQAKL